MDELHMESLYTDDQEKNFLEQAKYAGRKNSQLVATQSKGFVSDLVARPLKLPSQVVSDDDVELLREMENKRKEREKFAGYFSLRTVFYKEEATTGMKRRKMNRPNQEETMVDVVEQQQYPGFDSAEITPIPLMDGSDAADMLRLAVLQSRLLDKKMQWYKTSFHTILFSPASINILQDFFWFVFLQTWQNSKATERKLFHRISYNYTQVLTSANENRQFADSFIKHYPNVLAQAVHISFCHAYPETEFHGKFRNKLVTLAARWMTGLNPLRPAHHSWKLGKGAQLISKNEEVAAMPLPAARTHPSRLPESSKFEKGKESDNTDSQTTITPLDMDQGMVSSNATRITKETSLNKPSVMDDAICKHSRFSKKLSGQRSVASSLPKLPTFEKRLSKKLVFDMCGCSPLIAHYFASKRCRPTTSQKSFYSSWTEYRR